MKANSKTTVAGASFDANDSNQEQHWLLLTSEELTGFDQFCINKTMPKLDEVLAAARESMETECNPLSEEVSLEEATQPMTELLTSIEAEKEGYNVKDIEDAIASLRQTFIQYLGNVKPASPALPIPISWLIENRGFDENSSGWTKGPESIKNGVAEFYEQTFNTYQTISPALPAGNYALTLNAFQRPGTYQDAYTDWADGKEVVKAQLYATGGGSTVYQTIQNIWDGAQESSKTGQCVKYNNLFIPNNNMAAKSWFEDGLYKNLLSVNLPSASTLKIGIRSQKSGDSWWTCFDNFDLLYYGPFEVEDPDAIDEIEDTMSNDSDAWFSLDGRRMEASQLKHGIYVKKGKKILF